MAERAAVAVAAERAAAARVAGAAVVMALEALG